jgi:small subunit ribosomal protein S17
MAGQLANTAGIVKASGLGSGQDDSEIPGDRERGEGNEGTRMKERGSRKKLVGVVIGHRMDKTTVISVSRLKRHRTYLKYLTVRKTYVAHDPKNLCQVGDKVRIVESRPISKTKRWHVLDILEKGRAELVVPEAVEGLESQS